MAAPGIPKPARLRVALAEEPPSKLALDVGGAAVQLTVRPATTAMVLRAEWAARLAVAEKGGGETDRAARLGIHFATFVAELGRAAIVGWDVLGEDGAPLACEPDTVALALAMNPAFASAFETAYDRPQPARQEEGNVSPPAPNGISAAGGTTALPVNPKTDSAANAPT